MAAYKADTDIGAAEARRAGRDDRRDIFIARITPMSFAAVASSSQNDGVRPLTSGWRRRRRDTAQYQVRRAMSRHVSPPKAHRRALAKCRKQPII